MRSRWVWLLYQRPPASCCESILALPGDTRKSHQNLQDDPLACCVQGLQLAIGEASLPKVAQDPPQSKDPAARTAHSPASHPQPEL